jgi:predicted Zn-dependent protease
MRLRTSSLWATLALALLIVSVPSGVEANWMGRTYDAGICGVPNMPDNKDVYFHYDTVEVPELVNTSNWVRSELLDGRAGGIHTYYSETESQYTDAVGIARYYESYCEAELNQQWTTDGYTDLLGFANCDTLNSSGRCQHGTYRVSRYVYDNRALFFRRNMACHEIGHVLGLLHRSSNLGCMPGGRDGADEYSDHDRSHWTEFSNDPS